MRAPACAGGGVGQENKLVNHIQFFLQLLLLFDHSHMRQAKQWKSLTFRSTQFVVMPGLFSLHCSNHWNQNQQRGERKVNTITQRILSFRTMQSGGQTCFRRVILYFMLTCRTITSRRLNVRLFLKA